MMVKALSPADSIFLLLEQRRLPMHVAGLYVFTPMAGSGPDYVKQLYERWRTYRRAEPPFDQVAVRQIGGWSWQTDDQFDVDLHLSHHALPRPGRDRDLLALVSRLHGTLLDRSRPLWTVHLIEGLADGRFALYIKLHHALVDGVSAIRLISQSFAATPELEMPPLWALAGAAAAAPKRDDRRANRLAQAWRAGSALLPGIASGLVDLLRKPDPDEALTHPFRAPPTPFNVKVTGARRFVAQRYPLARLRAIGRAAGATLNDVTLAISAGALRRYLVEHGALPDKSLVAMVPVSLHDKSGAGGNQVALILAELATDEADAGARLHRIVAATAAGKARLQALGRGAKVAYSATMLAPMLPAALIGRAGERPPFNLAISNVPGPREVEYLDGARLDECYPVSIPFDYMALNITVTSYVDTMSFGFVACRKAVPDLQRMVDHLEDALVELERALPAPVAEAAEKIAAVKASPKKTAAKKATVKTTVTKKAVKRPAQLNQPRGR